MYRIGIVGYGYVGSGMHLGFGDWVTAIYDPYAVIPENVKAEKESFEDLDMVIICVPTNISEDGMTGDFSIVDESIKWVVELNPKLLILVKSAVVPSEIEMIKKKYNARVVISPEYLGEGGYFVPFWQYPDPKEIKYHTFQIFGGDKKDTSACVDIFIRKFGPHVHYYQSDLRTAALCKYMENCWFATKVTFCNEWFDIAKAHGVDYNALRELWVADSRVEKMHTAVFPDSRGFGGKCLPKDMMAIVKDTDKKGYDAEIMKSVLKVNKKLRGELS